MILSFHRNLRDTDIVSLQYRGITIIPRNRPALRVLAIRHRPIMPEILPIMLLSIAQKLSLLCSKLCFQNQDYALEVTVLLEYISLS